MTDWIRDRDYECTFKCSDIFAGYKYTVWMYVEETDATVKYWVGVSSGKKRKDLGIFMEKANKSLGGIKALFWIKSKMFGFPAYYKKRTAHRKKEYICIQWADSRRRDIYSRLQKEGFKFMTINKQKTLIKKL